MIPTVIRTFFVGLMALYLVGGAWFIGGWLVFVVITQPVPGWVAAVAGIAAFVAILVAVLFTTILGDMIGGEARR